MGILRATVATAFALTLTVACSSSDDAVVSPGGGTSVGGTGTFDCGASCSCAANQVCTITCGNTACTVDVKGGGITTVVGGTAAVTVSCEDGANCTVNGHVGAVTTTCGNTGACTVNCGTGACEMTCSGAACTNNKKGAGVTSCSGGATCPN